MALRQALDRLLECGLEVLVEARVLDRGGGARGDDGEELALPLVETLLLGEARDADPTRAGASSSGAAPPRATPRADRRHLPEEAQPLRALLEQRGVSRRWSMNARGASSVRASRRRASAGEPQVPCRSKSAPSPSSSHVETRSPAQLVDCRVADRREDLFERQARRDRLAHLVERDAPLAGAGSPPPGAASRGRAGRRE